MTGAGLLSIQAGGQPVRRLCFTNVALPGGLPAYQPPVLTVTAHIAAARARHPNIDLVRLELPSGWLSDRATVRPLGVDTAGVVWTVYPKEPPPGFRAVVGVQFLAATAVAAAAHLELPLELDLRSQFLPVRDLLPWTNSTASLGEIAPDWQTFRETFKLVVLPRAFFSGLYARMERIDDAGGGICNGLVHLALERSLTGEREPPRLADVLRWHGRQLGDRAVLAAAPWFLVPSPRRAFHHFRRDLVERGRSDIAFDIAQPKLWRRDLARAFQNGHTVLPYGVRQSQPDHAEVLVYDSNDPEAAQAGRSVVTFDLAHDRYSYPGRADLADGSTTVFATRQRSYRNQTALLASLASLVLYPRSLRRASPLRLVLLGMTLGMGVVMGVWRGQAGRANRVAGKHRQPRTT